MKRDAMNLKGSRKRSIWEGLEVEIERRNYVIILESPKNKTYN